MNRCKECNRIVNKDVRRGLCRTCYRDPTIKHSYDCLPRGTWKESDKARQWTIFETGRLRVLFQKGLSDKEIAKELNRAVGSVTKKRQSIRHYRSKLTSTPTRQGQIRSRLSSARTK